MKFPQIAFFSFFRAQCNRQPYYVVEETVCLQQQIVVPNLIKTMRKNAQVAVI